MSFSIRANGGRQLAEVEIERLSGQAGLGHFRLFLNLKIRIDAQSGSDEHLVDLSAEALVGGTPLGRFRQSPQGTPVRTATAAFPVTTVLEMELDRTRLEAVENRRGGGGLELILNVHADVEGPNGLRRDFSQLVHHVNQGVWVSILEQMGYRKTLLLEIPVPDRAAAPALAKAVDLLVQAQGAVGRGDYRETVGLCRDVMEAMSEALADDDAGSPIAQELFAGQRQMSKTQRLQLLRRALKTFTHPARHHDAASGAFDWERTDGLMALTIAAALVAAAPPPGGASSGGG